MVNSAALLKRGLLLEYTTLGWNVVGVVLVLAAAYAARSVALAGFGLDSLIEIFASVVVIWQLTWVNLQRERIALRLIGSAFIALVLYIVAQLLVTVLIGRGAVPLPPGHARPPSPAHSQGSRAQPFSQTYPSVDTPPLALS